MAHPNEENTNEMDSERSIEGNKWRRALSAILRTIGLRKLAEMIEYSSRPNIRGVLKIGPQLELPANTGDSESTSQLELSPELEHVLAQLLADYDHGIFEIQPSHSSDDYAMEDRTGGIERNEVERRLRNNDNELLRKIASMQGGGRLIGTNGGKLVFLDRTEGPDYDAVYYLFDKNGKRHTLTSDREDKDELLRRVRSEELRWANVYEILEAVTEDGYLVPETPLALQTPNGLNWNGKCDTLGIPAVVEAITGRPYIDKNTEERRRMKEAIVRRSSREPGAAETARIQTRPNNQSTIVKYDHRYHALNVPQPYCGVLRMWIEG